MVSVLLEMDASYLNAFARMEFYNQKLDANNINGFTGTEHMKYFRSKTPGTKETKLFMSSMDQRAMNGNRL